MNEEDVVSTHKSTCDFAMSKTKKESWGLCILCKIAKSALWSMKLNHILMTQNTHNGGPYGLLMVWNTSACNQIFLSSQKV